jgi:hypothetical protein
MVRGINKDMLDWKGIFCFKKSQKYFWQKENYTDIRDVRNTTPQYERCRTISVHWVQILNIPIIKQKYFESGHSQMVVDSVHGQTEKNVMYEYV